MSEDRAARDESKRTWRETLCADPVRKTEYRKLIGVSDAEARLILRLRQAAGQGRLVVVDPDAMAWYLCGQQERGK